MTNRLETGWVDTIKLPWIIDVEDRLREANMLVPGSQLGGIFQTNIEELNAHCCPMLSARHPHWLIREILFWLPARFPVKEKHIRLPILRYRWRRKKIIRYYSLTVISINMVLRECSVLPISLGWLIYWKMRA